MEPTRSGSSSSSSFIIRIGHRARGEGIIALGSSSSSSHVGVVVALEGVVVVEVVESVRGVIRGVILDRLVGMHIAQRVREQGEICLVTSPKN
jgi:tetrahydromethanopterin S-methyltransferase subunit C